MMGHKVMFDRKKKMCKKGDGDGKGSSGGPKRETKEKEKKKINLHERNKKKYFADRRSNVHKES